MPALPKQNQRESTFFIYYMSVSRDENEMWYEQQHYCTYGNFKRENKLVRSRDFSFGHVHIKTAKAQTHTHAISLSVV